jgi:hypothetical protein
MSTRWPVGGRSGNVELNVETPSICGDAFRGCFCSVMHAEASQSRAHGCDLAGRIGTTDRSSPERRGCRRAVGIRHLVWRSIRRPKNGQRGSIRPARDDRGAPNASSRNLGAGHASGHKPLGSRSDYRSWSVRKSIPHHRSLKVRGREARYGSSRPRAGGRSSRCGTVGGLNPERLEVAEFSATGHPESQRVNACSRER